MAEFQKELLDTVANRGKGDIADAIGMPDQQDYETLKSIIQKYEKAHPGEIAFYVNLGRSQFEAGRYGRNLRWKGEAEVNKDSRARLVLELPPNLGAAIETVFPSMFRSKKHLRWFTEKFPFLTISGKKL